MHRIIPQKDELEGALYVALGNTPTFSLQKTLKVVQNCKKKMHFTLQLMIHLRVQSRAASEGTFDGAPKYSYKDLHKDAQESSFEVALKGATEVALELHL